MILLEVKNVSKKFPIRGGVFNKVKQNVHAVTDVSLTLKPGETLGVVGESGCGKTTLARMIVRLLQPDSGEINFAGTNIAKSSGAALKSMRRDMQMIFQDPFSSLNPRMPVGDLVAEPLIIHNVGKSSERTSRVNELLDLVGLPRSSAKLYPHEFSGGQRQRIGIARAIALQPKLIVCDEPVSALDVSVQGEILNLLLDLQERFGMSYLFIAHDIKVVAQISHRIAVMYLGKIMEVLPAEKILDSVHPYTRALLSAVPEPDPHSDWRPLAPEGDVPSPINPPFGCVFHPRCSYTQPECRSKVPVLEVKRPQNIAACHFPIIGE